MAAPLIATKLFVPQRGRALVARPRLLERVRRGAGSKLTLVSAPAGFGKTTLLAGCLHEIADANRRGTWLSLDASDNEPATFWTYVVTALRSVMPGVGAAALELLADRRPTDVVLTTLLNELVAAPEEVWLVLDDFQLVDNPEVGQGMAFLLTHLPPHVHLVLSTRTDPDLPLARWRARGELVEIRAADLRFTLDEATEYLHAVTGLRLTAADVQALEERTEGWIAALQLAALSIQGREDVSGFVAQFAGTDRHLVDYLVEEVLATQPEPVRQFLLRSAVLERLTAPLCDAVVGRADARAMLLTLERANLFLVPLDDRREWFRYHHLFADVLRARLLAGEPDLVPLLHRRACRWYAAHGFADDAIRHALAAGDDVHAAYLMEQAVPAIRRDRREAVLLGWLQALPDDVLRASPVLGVFYGYLLMAAGDLEAFSPRLDDAERALAAAPGGSDPRWARTEELRTLPATIAVYRASLAQAHGDLAGTEQHARRALALAGPDDHLARGSAAGFLGLVAWARGDVSGAVETFTQAVASLHASGNLVDALASTVVLADLWRTAGHPGTARRLLVRALEIGQTRGGPVLRATPGLHVALGELDVERCDLAEAKGHLETAAALGEGAAMSEGRYRWFTAMAQLAEAEGDPQQAIHLLDTAEQLYRPGFVPELRPVAALRARIWITQGRLSDAAGWARDRGVSATDEATYLHEFDHLTLVRLLLARHRAHPDPGALDQALRLLARLHEAAETAGRRGSLPEIEMLRAVAQDTPDHGPQARSPVDPAPAEALSARELQVLRLLDSELTGPQIARELFVTVNTLRSHTKRIFTKLEVTSRRAAVRRARERGLL